jgi:CxxC motif-containing protein (DUF1111 family)
MAAGADNLPASLPGLTPEEVDRFNEGLAEFMEEETPEEGLGPVFNGKSCAECHAVPKVGGSEPNVGVARETRIGTLDKNGKFDPMESAGGGLLQQRAVSLPGCRQLTGEVVPKGALYVSRRLTTPLFGAGLIEAIPRATIEQNIDKYPDRHGKPNKVFNPDTGENGVLGRFGWKAQVATLRQFAGDAYLNEMGITNRAFPKENMPQGQDYPRECDLKDDPEDEGNHGVDAFTDFMQFLAPLDRPPVTDPTKVSEGEAVFRSIGCASCHVPTMQTAQGKDVNLYSDLLLHAMGAGLADGIEQGEAKGDEFRTAPLWGLSSRTRFMHDGGANTVADAILRHGGDAKDIPPSFKGLSQAKRDALLIFLGSL